MTATSQPLARYRFSVDEDYRLAEAGILDEGSRVELIEGEIVMQAARNGAPTAPATR